MSEELLPHMHENGKEHRHGPVPLAYHAHEDRDLLETTRSALNVALYYAAKLGMLHPGDLTDDDRETLGGCFRAEAQADAHLQALSPQKKEGEGS